MATSIAINSATQALMNELKPKYKVKTNEALLEKSLMIAKVLMDECANNGIVTFIKKDGTEMKLQVTG